MSYYLRMVVEGCGGSCWFVGGKGGFVEEGVRGGLGKRVGAGGGSCEGDWRRAYWSGLGLGEWGDGAGNWGYRSVFDLPS